MSKRLQLVLPGDELEEIRQIARRHGLTVGQWVRRALRAARAQEPILEASRKLEAVQEASRHSFPTADIDQMLAEIERGRQG